MLQGLVVVGGNVVTRLHEELIRHDRFFNDVFDAAVSGYDQALERVVAQLRPLPADRVNIVAAHCFVEGGEASESERPLAVGGADQVSARHFEDFDYAALGHLHRAKVHQQVVEQPVSATDWAGVCLA